MKQLSAKNSQLTKLIRSWIRIEENIIEATNEKLDGLKDSLLKTFIECIRDDSKRHRELLNLAINDIGGKDLLTEEDKGVLEDFINQHVHIEQEAVEIAEASLKLTSSPAVRLILDYLLLDEKKHDHLMFELAKLDQLKRPKY
jgi:hypothetical protein